MSKSNNQPGAESAAKSTEAGPTKPHSHSQGVGRETIESIAFAFVLALLFRSFVAEAFVIPTGSMAPTLYGRNKDVVCPGCGLPYAIGASDEVNEEGFLVPQLRIDQSMCPNCRHMHSVKSLPVFKGDRILVNKSSYQFGDPDRWDVIVFRYPEDTQKNYIKRLVGLPGETIRIERGDVYARQGAAGEFQILRKQDPNKQKLLQQTVYDDRHPPWDLIRNGWPEAWQAVSPESGSWKQDFEARRFEIQASDALQVVRYQHLVPTLPDWAAAEDGRAANSNPRPQLVSDFCGYNAYTGGRSPGLDDDRFWVGDLTMSCVLKISSVSSKDAVFVLELNEGVRRYRCKIDVTTGKATLTRNADLAADPENSAEIELVTANTSVKGPGTYSLRFANVDDRLCLWVNDNWTSNGLVMQAPYDAPANRRPQTADLTPAAFAAQGLAASVSDLLIERDIYYRAESVANDAGIYAPAEHEVDESLRLREALDDPQEWGNIYEQYSHKIQFHELGPDEFFVMGDNSPRSQDSRLWPNQRRAPNRHAVGRQALIGKAFFIYWPHGVPFLNDGHGFNILGHRTVTHDGDNEFARQERHAAADYPEYSFPFYPQWWRWKRIR